MLLADDLHAQEQTRLQSGLIERQKEARRAVAISERDAALRDRERQFTCIECAIARVVYHLGPDMPRQIRRGAGIFPAKTDPNDPRRA